MKAEHYIFVTNENKEVVRFCGQVKKKEWLRRKGMLPYLFWHHHLVKEVWLPENAIAVHAGVFTELTALEDIHLPTSDITLFEGCLPDHKVTIHLPFDASCREGLRAYDWQAEHTVGSGFASILWHVQNGKARLHLTPEADCCEVTERCWPVSVDITMDGKA